MATKVQLGILSGFCTSFPPPPGGGIALIGAARFFESYRAVNGPLCVVRVLDRIFRRSRRDLASSLARENARPPSIGSGTNKLTWQLNVSRRRARIIARVSQRAHCAWRKNRLRARPPVTIARAASCRRKSRLVSLHPRKGGKFVTFTRRRIAGAPNASKCAFACASEVRGKPTCWRT